MTGAPVAVRPVPLFMLLAPQVKRIWHVEKMRRCDILTAMELAFDDTTRARQGELGQFLTPRPVADFMASMFGPLPRIVRLLDAGAGAGALTESLVRRLCQAHDGVEAIEATLYEFDPLIQDALARTLRECNHRCASAGIRFTSAVHAVDFIQDASGQLSADLFSSRPVTFDAAIANPPYRKISMDSAERHALRLVGIETSNLYTGFIALIHRLLGPGGQIVAITPRSFCNGPYFRPFREDLLGSMELRWLHVFESRQAAFRDDNVLQENVIFHAVKGQHQPAEVVISSSTGEPGDAISKTLVPFTEVVQPGDAEGFIRIPSAPSHALAKEAVRGLTCSLASLGVMVSTGPVVEFRLRHALRREPECGTVPLLYPCHFNGGTIHWPNPQARKPNAILDNAETRPWLVPSGVYLLIKRFTSKEERRRLVACLFDPRDVKVEWIGIENHLNYFHADGHGLDRLLAAGLFLFLNSTLVDQCFRSFSGHTQVNATDLRTMAYPDRATLTAMGSDAGGLDISQELIDQLLVKHLHV